jgi:hypothetical protein
MADGLEEFFKFRVGVVLFQLQQAQGDAESHLC